MKTLQSQVRESWVRTTYERREVYGCNGILCGLKRDRCRVQGKVKCHTVISFSRITYGASLADGRIEFRPRS